MANAFQIINIDMKNPWRLFGNNNQQPDFNFFWSVGERETHDCNEIVNWVKIVTMCHLWSQKFQSIHCSLDMLKSHWTSQSIHSIATWNDAGLCALMIKTAFSVVLVHCLFQVSLTCPCTQYPFSIHQTTYIICNNKNELPLLPSEYRICTATMQQGEANVENWIAINILEHSYRWTHTTQKCRWFSNTNAHLFDCIKNDCIKNGDESKWTEMEWYICESFRFMCNRTFLSMIDVVIDVRELWTTSSTTRTANKKKTPNRITYANNEVDSLCSAGSRSLFAERQTSFK